MTQIDSIARVLTGTIAVGFVMAGVLDVLDYAIVKFLLFGAFIFLAIYVFVILLKKENHPET